MQKTEHHARLLHLSTTGKGFCVLALLLIITVAAGRAGEPGLTLALADHSAPPETNVLVQTNFLSSSDNSLFALGNSPSTTSFHPGENLAVNLTAESLLEKTAGSGQRDSFQLIRENASRSNGTFSVQAGYGRTWDEKSMLSQISAGHQDVGCAYLRANISF